MMTLSEHILSLTQDANIVGELLRDKFFNQDRENGKFGCYSTFELNNGVVKLPDEMNEEFVVKVICAKLDDIVMKYWWEHDGDLSFYFLNGEILNNSDAKKSHGWQWLSTPEN